MLQDNQVTIDLKQQISKEGRALKNGEETIAIVCVNLTGILTSYILKNRHHIPKTVDDLYQFVISKGQKYKSLGIGLQNISLWF